MNHPAIKNGAYDVNRLRADFPILSREIYDKPLVYFDNAASAQKPRAVLDRMRQAYELEYSNVHRGLHFLANAATEGYEGAREGVRGFLNAKSTSEIVFTRNATEAINLVAASYGLAHISKDDEIVLSIMEHHSNIVPWHFHRERKGAVIKWAPIDEDGNFLLSEFEKLLNSSHQDCRNYADVECARYRRPDQRGRKDCPRTKDSRLGRWQPGGGSFDR